MRIRQIKPEFFLDDELARSCTRDARFLFVGLWLIADKRGRLEDRPARIKAMVFPYEHDITPDDVDGMLGQLSGTQFIIRYANNGHSLIQIRTFEQHQHCHVHEPESKLPGPQDVDSIKAPQNTVQAPYKHHTRPCTSTSTSTSGVVLLDSAPSDSKGESSEPEPAVITLPLADGKSEHPITAACVAELSSLYPGVDPELELRKVRGWLIANPTRRKTPRGIARFLHSWFSRAQDRAGKSNNGDRPRSEFIESLKNESS